ncbi:unnamed protein product [Coregonus sp. 'balchen']|nr:unnamed protein product [Coregonus sp. 'balchen']
MEGKPNRGRQTSWKRGGGGGGSGGVGGGGSGGGSDSGNSGGEHRVRGRGRYGTGRGKRDHYRGRGRGCQPTPSFGRDQDEGNRMDVEEDEGMEVFTKRKLKSNWDRYKESEKEESSDDTPTQRGTDYHVLLQSAGKECITVSFEMALASVVLTTYSALS